jgi:hypothetical protein
VSRPIDTLEAVAGFAVDLRIHAEPWPLTDGKQRETTFS